MEKILVVIETNLEELNCDKCDKNLGKVMLENGDNLKTVYCAECYNTIQSELEEAKSKLEDISNLAG